MPNQKPESHNPEVRLNLTHVVDPQRAQRLAQLLFGAITQPSTAIVVGGSS